MTARREARNPDGTDIVDGDISPEHCARSLVRALSSSGLRIACAESCTGGLLAELITSVPGASVPFWGSVVSYREDAKTKLLGVGSELLAKFGAVSEETAKAMALGVSILSGADLSISTTGFAGPGGGEPGKPVGTVWIGICRGSGEASAFPFRFEGDRNTIRRAAALQAMRIALSALRNRS